MSITRITSSKGTGNATTLPAHQVGDLLVVLRFVETTNSVWYPDNFWTRPATNGESSGSGGGSIGLYRKVAASTEETIPNGNAEVRAWCAIVYRGASIAGGNTVSDGTQADMGTGTRFNLQIPYDDELSFLPIDPFADPEMGSWGLRAAVTRSMTANLATAMPGYTLLQSGVDEVNGFQWGVWDSNGPIAEPDSGSTLAVGGDPASAMTLATDIIGTGVAPEDPELVVEQQPTATQSGYLIDPAPVVHVLDAEGALDTSFTGDVTASLLGSGGVLLGTLTVAAVAGVATFSNLRPCEAGSYQLRFSASGYANLDSAVFAVTAGEGSTNVIVHQEAPMRPIRRNEPTAELRDIPIEILADDGSPWDGDPDAGGGLKAQLSQNFGTETPSPANIVKLAPGNFRVRPTDAYCDIAEGSIIKARVPAAAGRREGKGWAHIIPADTYVSADAARKALVDAVVIASDGGNGYDVVKQPESNQIQRTIPDVGVITITATFSPSVPGIVSAGGS